MGFDLARFTWPGWLLFFGSFVFWFLQVVLLTTLFPEGDIADNPKWKVLAGLTLVSSLLFFVVGA